MMSENKNPVLSQEAAYRWLQAFSNNCAIRSSVVIVIVFAFDKYARYLLSYVGGYPIKSMSITVMLTIVGLLLGTFVIEAILWKVGCPRPIRSGIWLGISIGPLMGILMFERGKSPIESIVIGVIIFALTFTAIYLLEKRIINRAR